MTIVSPFPPEHYDKVLGWLEEFPEANFDDYCPRDPDRFTVILKAKLSIERSWGIFDDQNKPCGIVAFDTGDGKVGMLRGICFSKGHASSEDKRWAMTKILAELFGLGYEKIEARWFADNAKVALFLGKFGFTQDGLHKNLTRRGGVPLDVVSARLHRKDF